MGDHLTMNELPESERPMEKMLRFGSQALSDAELLAVIMRTGSREMNSSQLAQKILSLRRKNLLNLYELSMGQLMAIPGVGQVKAAQLKAVAELSRRIAATGRQDNLKLDSPETIADFYMEQMRHLPGEQFRAAFFDARCVYLGDSIISQGSVTEAVFSVRDLVRNMLNYNTVIMVLVHNHPSGDPRPSRQDILVTGKIRDLAGKLSVDVADHIIIGDNRYISFREEGVEPFPPIN